MAQTTRTIFTQTELPLFNAIDPAKIEKEITDRLEHNLTAINLLLTNEPFTWQHLMEPLENMSDDLNKLWSPIAHLHAVKETDSLRQAYQATLPHLSRYQTALAQNEKLFSAMTVIQQSPAFKMLTDAARKIIENDIRDFTLAGVNLPAEKKLILSNLQEKLSNLMTTFSENVLDATHAFNIHITDATQLQGLPEQSIKLAAQHAKAQGKDGFLLTLDQPSYVTGMRFLGNRDLRKQLYEAYVTRASDQGPQAKQFDNTPVIEAILKTRHDIATILGFADFADYSLATKMAKTKEEVFGFLEDLVNRCKPLAKQEQAAVVALAKQDGITDCQSWDLPYYSEQLFQSTYHFSQEALRPYFPINSALNGMFTIVNKLYGIEIQCQPDIETWHTDVKFYAVYDKSQTLRAGFYIDLYARPHKRDGAWMDECRAKRRLSDGTLQLPVAYLTCNFMPPVGDDPALLTHDDVITLFHEFGHCLHHMLTKVECPAVGGINGVPWDAVEFPSQFMENFCWEKASLDLIAHHYQTDATLPDELYQKMIDAKYFQSGLQMLRQLEFSLFDFHLHADYQPEKMNQAQTVLDQVRQSTAVIMPPAWNRFQNSFSHIFGGSYAAGYYSYKWAEVLSADAYAQFEETGLFNPATGKAFLENILEVGGVRDPMDSFIAFRGRKPTIDALLRLNGIEAYSSAKEAN